MYTILEKTKTKTILQIDNTVFPLFEKLLFKNKNDIEFDNEIEYFSEGEEKQIMKLKGVNKLFNSL